MLMELADSGCTVVVAIRSTSGTVVDKMSVVYTGIVSGSKISPFGMNTFAEAGRLAPMSLTAVREMLSMSQEEVCGGNWRLT